jgi:hypothetical protein
MWCPAQPLPDIPRGKRLGRHITASVTEYPEKFPAPELGERWDFDNPQMIRQYLPRFYHEEDEDEGR